MDAITNFKENDTDYKFIFILVGIQFFFMLFLFFTERLVKGRYEKSENEFERLAEN